MTVADALIDPNLTIKLSREPRKRDPGYNTNEYRTSVDHDKTSKVIKDYANRNIIKINEPSWYNDWENQQKTALSTAFAIEPASQTPIKK